MKYKKFIFLWLTYLFFFTRCIPIHPVVTETGQFKYVKEINRVIRDSGLKANMGIKVVSLQSGKTLYELNSERLFTPASNNKLYTGLGALMLLGKDFTFETSVYLNGSTLILKGGGDPDLTLEQLDSLANTVASYVEGVDVLLLDDTLLDSVPFGTGWMWDEGPWWYAAQISALTVNDNVVDFIIAPGTIAKPVEVTLSPQTDYILVQNNSMTVQDTTGLQELKIERDWFHETNNFLISGNLLVTSPVDTFYRNIEDPTLFAGTVFREMLEAHKVRVGIIKKGSLPDNSKLLTSHKSAPLLEAVTNLLKKSDNLSAELLIKVIGHESSGTQGTWQNGLQAIKTFLYNEIEIDTAGLYLADGSGVSRYNLTTPTQLVKLLTFAFSREDFRESFLTSLPIGGWDGTLKKRMKNSSAGNRIHAKTGTLEGVSCLSGYAFTKNNEPLAFSIMMNGYVGSASPYRKLQDDICRILVDKSHLYSFP